MNLAGADPPPPATTPPHPDAAPILLVSSQNTRQLFFFLSLSFFQGDGLNQFQAPFHFTPPRMLTHDTHSSDIDLMQWATRGESLSPIARHGKKLSNEREKKGGGEQLLIGGITSSARWCDTSADHPFTNCCSAKGQFGLENYI